MVYRTNDMILTGIQELFVGRVNDVIICRDIASPLEARYLLLVVKDRECAKRMLLITESSERKGGDGPNACLRCFSQAEHLCFLYEYRPERRLLSFAEGQMRSIQIREQTCINLVMECLSTRLPLPLLYLVLDQTQIHIQKDNRIYFNPGVDLASLNPDIAEADCATRCAQLILTLLSGRTNKRVKSLTLLEKKVSKHAYRSLPEIYRDIKITALPRQKVTPWLVIRGWWRLHQDLLFRILLVACGVLALAALVVLISQLLFGDVPLFRLFQQSFELIGTESMRR